MAAKAVWAGALAVVAATAAQAAVERIEISERVPLAAGARFGKAGAYEKIRGVAWIALDPDAPANARIVDLKNAARDAHGHVVFKSDFMMLRPVDPARRNGSLLYEVNNRGNIGILKQVNGSGSTRADAEREDVGNGFLFQQGFTLLWSAWAWDTLPSTARAPVFHLDPPVATDQGRPITGKVVYEALVDQPSPTIVFTGRASRAYPHADGADAKAMLTMRDGPRAPRRPIARARWRFLPAPDGFAPDTLALDGGFQPGHLYELTYVARDPVVVGAGLAGIRDLLSWFKANRFEGAAPLDRALVFGLSQSGRVITTMLSLGLNLDEAGKPAFDGGYAQVGGAGKGSFNHRFAMSTRHFSPLVDQIYPTDTFPFATVPTRDPATGRIASLLDSARSGGAPLPKMFFVNTSLEYWGRAASLLTTTPDGHKDVGVDPSARVYMIAGAQHYVGVSKTRAPFVNCVNSADHYPVERALIVALDNWVRGVAAPPANAYPTIAGGDLIHHDLYRRLFPIAGMRVPDSQLRPPRLDLGPRFASQGIVDKNPPIAGAPFGALVPRPDQDGNDHAGIRLVEVEAPLGSHPGWNLRAPETGFPGAQTRYDGSFIPFARTRAERTPGDSREPIDERYRDKNDFLRKVRTAAERQVAAGTMLRPDVDLVVGEQSGLYDRVMAHDPHDMSCGYLYP